MMTRAQLEAIATAVNRVRPDWDVPGIRSALTKAEAAPWEVAVAAFRLAGTPDVRTPAFIPDRGRHWADTEVGKRPAPMRCPDHDEPAHMCRGCVAESVPMPDEVRATMRALTRVGPDRRPYVPEEA